MPLRTWPRWQISCRILRIYARGCAFLTVFITILNFMLYSSERLGYDPVPGPSHLQPAFYREVHTEHPQKAESQELKLKSPMTLIPVLLPVTSSRGQDHPPVMDPTLHPSPRQFEINCSNIGEVSMDPRNILGKGVTKFVYRGKYRSRKVAVKMVTPDVADVVKCLHELQAQKEHRANPKTNRTHQEALSPHQCYVFPNMKLMKEILLLHELEHPNLLQLLGYCIRGEETESRALSDHGVTAVYEYVVPVTLTQLYAWPMRTRLEVMAELVDLLHYLQHSPLGSLLLADLKKNHLLLRQPSSIVLNDLDDVSSKEPKCSKQQDDGGKAEEQDEAAEAGGLLEDDVYAGGAWLIEGHEGRENSVIEVQQGDVPNQGRIPKRPSKQQSAEGSEAPGKCGFGLPCQAGLCVGHNARYNMARMYQLIFSRLLNCFTLNLIPDMKGQGHSKVSNITLSLYSLCQQMARNQLSALQLKHNITQILHTL